MAEDSDGDPRSSFLTLTYDDEHLPEDGSLRVEDWQLFAKRLRKQKGKFRFLQCGEYGKEKNRPHHHACVYGIDFAEDRRLHETTAAGHKTFVSEELNSIWQKGMCLIGSVSFDSAAYVARYCTKKVGGDLADSHYSRTDLRTGRVHRVRPEFATMSRRPGLGYTWYQRWKHSVYPADRIIMDGKQMRPPRYYDRLLEKEDATLYSQVMKKRIAEAQKRVDPSRSDREQLRATEKISEAMLALKGSSL